MDLITVCNRFPTQQDCISHLESLRWPEQTTCPLCGSDDVARTATKGRRGRWNCHKCKSSFNVLSGTIFQGTKIPLQKWFVAIAILLNAKKSVSSCQLSRDLDLNQKSAWYMKMRIRDAMVEDSDAFLTGIVEADEAFLATDGSRKRDDDDDTPKRGRAAQRNFPLSGQSPEAER